MKKEDIEYLSSTLGASPVRVNSKKIAPAMRDRLYWTNIPLAFESKNLYKDIKFQDILEEGYVPREKARALLRSGSGIHGFQNFIKVYRRVEEKGFGNLVFSSEEKYKGLKEIYDKNFKKRMRLK